MEGVLSTISGLSVCPREARARQRKRSPLHLCSVELPSALLGGEAPKNAMPHEALSASKAKRNCGSQEGAEHKVHIVLQGTCVWLHPRALMHMCTSSHHVVPFSVLDLCSAAWCRPRRPECRRMRSADPPTDGNCCNCRPHTSHIAHTYNSISDISEKNENLFSVSFHHRTLNMLPLIACVPVAGGSLRMVSCRAPDKQRSLFFTPPSQPSKSPVS